MEKNSGERSSMPRLKRMQYDMLPKFVFVKIIFLLPWNIL
jgi:hypothetical protein